jgi:hypothetical protein
MDWTGIVESEMKWNFITCRRDKLKHGEMLEKGVVERQGGGGEVSGSSSLGSSHILLSPPSPFQPPASLTVLARTYGMM